MSDLGLLCALEQTWKPIRIDHRGLRSSREKCQCRSKEETKQGSCTRRKLALAVGVVFHTPPPTGRAGRGTLAAHPG
jgi:hypothetical protein